MKQALICTLFVACASLPRAPHSRVILAFNV